jgi:hypothetical protein
MPPRRLIATALVALASTIAAACSGDEPEPDPQAFCALVDELRASSSYEQVILDDPERTEATLDELIGTIERARNVAPESLRTGAQQVLDGLETLRTTLEEHDYDVAAAETALRETFAGEQGTLASYVATSNEFERGVNAECGEPPTTSTSIIEE